MRVCVVQHNCSITKSLENMHGTTAGNFSWVDALRNRTKPNCYELEPLLCVTSQVIFEVGCRIKLKCRMSFFDLFPKSRMSKDNWILWKCPSLDKRQCVENSRDKKGRVTLSRVSIFIGVWGGLNIFSFQDRCFHCQQCGSMHSCSVTFYALTWLDALLLDDVKHGQRISSDFNEGQPKEGRKIFFSSTLLAGTKIMSK